MGEFLLGLTDRDLVIAVLVAVIILLGWLLARGLKVFLKTADALSGIKEILIVIRERLR